MEPKTFMKNLDECSKSKENKTRAAEVLVALFNTLNATRRDMANCKTHIHNITSVLPKGVIRAHKTSLAFMF